MRLSVFNLYVPDHPDPGKTLIYNTFSGGFVSLDASTFAILKKADAGEDLDASERQLIEPEYFDEDVGILVESRAVEERAWREWYERSRSTAQRLQAIVSVTFACNFDCTYCCQADVLDGRTMKEDVGRDTAAWLARRAREIGAGEVHLEFVGGEPLLNPGRIEQIVADVRALTADLGVRVTFGLTTNGLFLTPDLVERWADLGLTVAQITLDGDETTHSRTRRSRRGDDTFAPIFANLVAAARRISVTVNGNYQDDTIHGFVPLLHKLRQVGISPGTRIRFTPALAAIGAPADSGSGSCTWSGSSPELMIALGDEARRAGFDAGDPTSVGPCGFHRHHYYAIDPEGALYKCPAFLGKTEWAIGDVRSGLGPRYRELLGLDVQQGCGSCSHRPECSGGCIAAEWIKTGRAEGVNCEGEFFERHGGELVKRKYALATSPSFEAAAAAFPPSPALFQRTTSDRASGHRSPALRVLA